MVVADHFLWFFYFAEKAQEAKRYNNSSKRFRSSGTGVRTRERAITPAMDSPSFMDVAAFFAVCVWFVPLFLFLSLSANDNVLPRMGKFRPISGYNIYAYSHNLSQIKSPVHRPAWVKPST
jgi:hypothetical protein